MGVKTEIQWSGSSWNPWYGCKKVSPACKFCYMYRDTPRSGINPKVVTRSKTRFDQPIKQKEGKLIFTCSWSDWFIKEADEWRDEAWEIIRQCPQHTFQILTKRPKRIKDHLPEFFDEIADRVWMGVSVESQAQVGRLEYLTDLPCKTFASFEPLLGPIKWDENMTHLDWCIIGGESGNETEKYRYRPMKLEWAEYLADQAMNNWVACFVKQMGTQLSNNLKTSDRHGSKMTEFPASLQVRDFPPNKHGK